MTALRLPLPPLEPDGRVRVVIESIAPAVDGGRFAVKRIAGEVCEVEADCFADGHDRLRAELLWRAAGGTDWQRSPMQPLANDRWRGRFTIGAPGRYEYTVTAWVDHFDSWRHDTERRVEPADLRIALQVGAELAEQAAARAGRGHSDVAFLTAWAMQLRTAAANPQQEAAPLRALALDEAAAAAAQRHPDRSRAALHAPPLPLVVDRERARFSAWYEFFPRSASATPGAHGTLRDAARWLDYVAELGFDVVYLPPIHSIGTSFRKGRNNSLAAQPDDVGSPWAIGAAEGGHTAVHPALGTLEDFDAFVTRAQTLGLEVALDIAFQCAPDHPYVAAHPQWFRRRPDGSIQYAENPPKKYQDIYPFDFESEDWPALWRELAGVMLFWIARGVKIFRVDNPHTKAFAFWEWAIGEIKARHPEVLFLSEAFTRPKVMHRLPKLGFSQSYTYYTWRNSKQELTAYFTELAQGPGRDTFRPNVWPNTPDILPETLQLGGRAAFAARLILAATLSSNYGIYGPAFEQKVAAPRAEGSEEYLDSEKYQLKHWDLQQRDSLAPLITRINSIRRANAALHDNGGLHFLATDNEQLLAYRKTSAAGDNTVICVVNLDPYQVQQGWVTLTDEDLGLIAAQPFQVHDLLTDAHYAWQVGANFVRLDPAQLPAHILRVQEHLRREHDFDYFL